MTSLLLSVMLFVPQGAVADKASAGEVLKWSAPVDVTRDFALVQGRPIGLLPPEPVCGATLESAQWSPDGGRLLLVRRIGPKADDLASGKPTKPQSELLGWSARTGRTVSYWSFDPDAVRIEKVAWMGGSDTVAVDTTWPSKNDPETGLIMLNPRRHRVFVLDADSGRSVAVYEGRTGERVRLATSEGRPKGVVQVTFADSPASYLLFDAVGRVSPVRRPANPIRVQAVWLGFDSTGEEVMLSRPFSDRIAYGRLNTLTGEIEPAGRLRPEVSSVGKRAEALPLEWSPLPGNLGVSASHGVLRVRIGKEKPLRLLVATDADGSAIAERNGGEVPSVSPDGKVVLYRHQGAGMVRPLVRPSETEWARMQAAWYRYRAMRDCAEASVALDEDQSKTKGTAGLTAAEWLRTKPGWDSAKASRLGDPSVQGRFVWTPLPEEKNAVKLNESVIGTVTTAVGVARLRLNGLIEWLPAGK